MLTLISSHIQIGDLNYRITSDVPTLQVFDYALGDIDYLLKKDQLKVSQRAGLAFEEFIEADIKFPPTYKYQKYTTTYDKKEGKKCRAPAWCDRILYRTGEGISPEDVEIVTYDHVMKLSRSDHKPVFALANVKIKDYDQAVMKKTRLRVERELKKTEGADKPVKVSLSTKSINFGDLKYKTRAVREMEVTNEGSGNAYFHFMPKAEDPHVSKRMFTVTPAYGVVQPGESQTIMIEAFIDSEAAHVSDMNKDYDDLWTIYKLFINYIFG